MSIGYACLLMGVADTGMKSCLMKNATPDRLYQLTASNLESLENIINYNIQKGIKLFRISSDLIPFGSHPVNDLEWWNQHYKSFEIIGNKIKKHGIRVSMHPGQYTVLNSPRQDVVNRAIQDLNYHCKVLDCLETGSENKIVLHIGGVYGDKKQSIERFINNFNKLPESVKNRLVIENDDSSYSIDEVLDIGINLGIPVVFDNLHHEVNPPTNVDKSINVWIERCRATWHKKDGRQKIHYSQQDYEKRQGGHSNSIRIQEFMDFYSNLEVEVEDIDIMLEVKDKNLSAVKCLNCTLEKGAIKLLEDEWSKYKYNVLEKSPKAYSQIRNLLKDKNGYPAIEFYSILDRAMEEEEVVGKAINGADHVWGYFKSMATPKEKENFQKQILDYRDNKTSISGIKRFLWRLALKYDQKYLLDSYYFVI